LTYVVSIILTSRITNARNFRHICFADINFDVVIWRSRYSPCASGWIWNIVSMRSSWTYTWRWKTRRTLLSIPSIWDVDTWMRANVIVYVVDCADAMRTYSANFKTDSKRTAKFCLKARYMLFYIADVTYVER